MTGRRNQYWPLNPESMARACRKLAQDMRDEAARGLPPIALARTGSSNQYSHPYITRAEAARSLDAQAERWEAEARGEERNDLDRRLLGWP